MATTTEAKQTPQSISDNDTFSSEIETRDVERRRLLGSVVMEIHGLDPRQHRYVEDEESIYASTSTIAEIMGVPTSSAAYKIREMIKDGKIKRWEKMPKNRALYAIDDGPILNMIIGGHEENVANSSGLIIKKEIEEAEDGKLEEKTKVFATKKRLCTLFGITESQFEQLVLDNNLDLNIITGLTVQKRPRDYIELNPLLDVISEHKLLPTRTKEQEFQHGQEIYVSEYAMRKRLRHCMTAKDIEVLISEQKNKGHTQKVKVVYPVKNRQEVQTKTEDWVEVPSESRIEYYKGKMIEKWVVDEKGFIHKGVEWKTANDMAKPGFYKVMIYKIIEDAKNNGQAIPSITATGFDGRVHTFYPVDHPLFIQTLEQKESNGSKDLDSSNPGSRLMRKSSEKDNKASQYVPSYATGGFIKITNRKNRKTNKTNKKSETINDGNIDEGIEEKTEKDITTSKGDTFEQLAGLLLAYDYPEHTVLGQYSLDQEWDGVDLIRAGCRVDFKLVKEDEEGNQLDPLIYEIKWGRAKDNIPHTVKKQKYFIHTKPENQPYINNYHLLCLDPYTHVVDGVLVEQPELFLRNIENADTESTLSYLLTDILTVGEKNGSASKEDVYYVNLLRDYFFDLIEHSNRHKKDRRKFIDNALAETKPLLENIKNDGSGRDLLVDYLEEYLNNPEKKVSKYSGTWVTAERNGVIFRSQIDNMSGLDKEERRAYRRIYKFDGLKFNCKLDRDIAVMIITASKEITSTNEETDVKDVISGSESEKPVFTVNGITISSHPETNPDFLIKKLEDLRKVLTFGKLPNGVDIFDNTRSYIKKEKHINQPRVNY